MGAPPIVVPICRHEPTVLAWRTPTLGWLSEVPEFAVSIDEVEAVTGIDFFFRVDDDVEDQVESAIDLALWDW